MIHIPIFPLLPSGVLIRLPREGYQQLIHHVSCYFCSHQQIDPRTSEKVACLSCFECKSIQNNSYPDFTILDCASDETMKIEAMKELTQEVLKGPFLGSYKIILICMAHRLTPQALSALLKTLEEPPPYLSFWLVTHQVGKLPLTIRSRCVYFSPALTTRLSTDIESIAMKQEYETYADILFSFLNHKNFQILKKSLPEKKDWLFFFSVIEFLIIKKIHNLILYQDESSLKNSEEKIYQLSAYYDELTDGEKKIETTYIDPLYGSFSLLFKLLDHRIIEHAQKNI